MCKVLTKRGNEPVPLQVLAKKGSDRLDRLGDIRLGVVQVDVQPGIQPDQALRLGHPLVGFPGTVR